MLLQEWKSHSSQSTMKHQQFENDKWTLPWGTRVSWSNYGRTRQSDWETWMSDLNQIRTVAEKALQYDWGWVIHNPLISSICFYTHSSFQGSGRKEQGEEGGGCMDLFIKIKKIYKHCRQNIHLKIKAGLKLEAHSVRASSLILPAVDTLQHQTGINHTPIPSLRMAGGAEFHKSHWYQ